MEPIISPWLIYLLGVIEGARGVLFASAVITGICSMIYIICKAMQAVSESSGNDYQRSCAEQEKAVAKRFRLSVFLFPCFLFLAVITPSRDTMIAMLVAQNVTENNVKKAVETGKVIKDEIKRDILDIIQEVTKEKGKK